MLPARAQISSRMRWRNRRRVRRRTSGRSHSNDLRDYDPAVGRYVESDPVGIYGGLNTYAYVENDPLINIDPTGQYDCTYSISNHTMTCTPRDQGNPPFASNSFVSGNNQAASCPNCQNNPNRVDQPNHGPAPPGRYGIGAQHPNSSRRDLTPDQTNQMHNRNALQTHGCTNPATCSNGCIAATTNAVRDELNRILHLEEGRNSMTGVP